MAEAEKVARLVAAVVDGTGVPAQVAADSVILELRMAEKALAGPEAFETEDFRIPTEGWKFAPDVTADDNLVRVNPEGDVWEIFLEDGSKEQLFTFEAALRETAKAGKLMPTERQWYAALQRAERSLW